MTDYRRDAALAGCCGAVLVAVLLVTGGTATLARPGAVLAGVFGALVVEAAFLADTPAAELWARPPVQVGAALALVGGAVGTAAVLGPVVVAVACWGLVTYFALLALTLAGYWLSA